MVKEIIQKYNTSDPFEIAHRLNILVIAEPLGKVASYFSPCLIHVNSEIPEYIQKLAVACQIYYILKNEIGLNFIFHNNLDLSNEAVCFGVQLLTTKFNYVKALERVIENGKCKCSRQK